MKKNISANLNKIIGLIFIAGFVWEANSFHVSVYYYPWYRNGQIEGSDRVLRYRLRPPQPPVLGSYSSNDRDVINQHIKWSEDYAVDNWIISWWGAGHRTDDAVVDNIAPLLNNSKVTYCLFFETTGLIGFGDVSGGNVNTMRDAARYMARNHFNQPSYYKINGRPVIYFYVSRTLTGQYQQGFQAMRDVAKTEGFDVYLIGDENYWGPLNSVTGELRHSFNDLDRLRSFDAVSPYNMHGGGTYDHSGFPVDNDLFPHIKNMYEIDKAKAEEEGVKFIPNASPGFNDRAQRLGDDHYPIPRRVHPDSSHVSTFSQFMDVAIETMDTTLKALTINSWNEWYEDSNIEPVVKSGSTTNDNNQNRYTLDYEYVGYGEDHLQLILDKKTEYNKPAPLALNFTGKRFDVLLPNKTLSLDVGYEVDKVQVFTLKGSLVADNSANENHVSLLNLGIKRGMMTNGILVLKLLGQGHQKVVKVFH